METAATTTRTRDPLFGPWGRTACVLAALSVACVGTAQDPGGGSAPAPGRPPTTGTGSETPGTPSPSAMPGAAPAVPAAPGTTAGGAPLRRLTATQYRNTVRDLLGLTDAVAATALPPDEAVAGKFTSNIVRPVQPADLDKYADAAALIAGKARTQLDKLVPCPVAAGDVACATRFIESFGRRAFRRPLDAAEIARLVKVYQAGGGFENGIRLVIEAFLQAPKFLYLVEPTPAGAAGQVVGLDGWSLAARLSYFLWNSTPDQGLLDAAARGALTSEEGLRSEAQRLLRDGRFTEALVDFHLGWLELHDLVGAEKNPMVFPAWNAALKEAMAEETRRFLAAVLGAEGDGKLATLLGAKWTYLSGPLYDVYGVPRPAGAAASEWRRVELPAAERAGLLTQPGLMAALSREDRTSFVRRGKMIREAIFCQEIPPPPPGVNDSDAEIPLTATAKERAEIHRRSPDCASCHSVFDPIGFAFEPYDAIGRHRTSEAGKPVDARLDLTGTSIDGSYPDAVALAGKLAAAPDVQACVARQWLRFALGREDGPADAATLKAAGRAMASDGDVRTLLLALVTSASFRNRALD